LDTSYWAAATIDGRPTGVVLLEPGLPESTRGAMLEVAYHVCRLSGEASLDGIAAIEEIDPGAIWIACRGAPAGIASDVGPLEWDLSRKLEFFRRVALAVDSLHRQGLAHGFVAPRNIWLDESLSPQLLPLRSAIQRDFDMTDPAVGYFTFLAPEVRDDPAGATVRADMFSLGRLLQSLISGSIPPEETTPVPHLGDLQNAPSRLVRIIRKTRRKLKEHASR
jgi:hypothetical protein